MALKRMDNVGIVVESLDTAISFFAELGMKLEGRTTIEGEWAGRVTGLGLQRVEIASEDFVVERPVELPDTTLLAPIGTVRFIPPPSKPDTDGVVDGIANTGYRLFRSDGAETLQAWLSSRAASSIRCS